MRARWVSSSTPCAVPSRHPPTLPAAEPPSLAPSLPDPRHPRVSPLSPTLMLPAHAPMLAASPQPHPEPPRASPCALCTQRVSPQTPLVPRRGSSRHHGQKGDRSAAGFSRHRAEVPGLSQAATSPGSEQLHQLCSRGAGEVRSSRVTRWRSAELLAGSLHAGCGKGLCEPQRGHRGTELPAARGRSGDGCVPAVPWLGGWRMAAGCPRAGSGPPRVPQSQCCAPCATEQRGGSVSRVSRWSRASDPSLCHRAPCSKETGSWRCLLRCLSRLARQHT